VVKLTVLVKRNPALSAEEFHALWREHGRMIGGEPTLARHVKRYEQHHRLEADYRNGDTFDGLALQWFDAYSDFIAFIQEPKYAELVQPDEDRLLDMAGLVVIFTDEAEVFIS
jgi:hypothetical protein